VLAVVRRHVHEAGAAVSGDELAGEEGARFGEEAAEMMHRVARDGAGEVGALDDLFVEKAQQLTEAITEFGPVGGRDAALQAFDESRKQVLRDKEFPADGKAQLKQLLV